MSSLDFSDPAITVGDIVSADFRTAAVFERHGIDFCCGGATTLAAASRRDGDVAQPRAEGRLTPKTWKRAVDAERDFLEDVVHELPVVEHVEGDNAQPAIIVPHDRHEGLVVSTLGSSEDAWVHVPGAFRWRRQCRPSSRPPESRVSVSGVPGG